MTRRLPWVAVGAAAALGAQTLVLVAGVALAAVGDRPPPMQPPAALRHAAAPPWVAGTCLVGREAVPCAHEHDAEVVAVVDPGRQDDEELRRWRANAVCAREVVGRAVDAAAPSLTHASTYPDDELQRRDARVWCLLVAGARTALTGSLTAGDLAVLPPPRLE
ncbi:hypothetical protein [Kineococcus sp. SYSU DK001]|uniref:hypothetical protein n=1 Tax=Kineococcus sp. SYSU DK001 TaxID=3383122 RepID=UPI003D7C7FF2